MSVNIAMRGRFFYFVILLAAIPAGKLTAQTDKVDSLLRQGDFLRSEYRFDESLDTYAKVLDILDDSTYVQTDSLLRMEASDKMLLSENGKNMAAFAYRPNVIARHCFPLDEFFLYYPLPDKSWRKVPNQLDTMLSGRLSKALFAPDNTDRIIYSSKDNDGIRNLYMTEYQDTIWTYPTLINEHLTSISNEVYPMLTNDGKSLYFSSEGLQGMGGYDLFVSEWNEEENDWSEPVNLGFPYSSPGNDYLLVNTPDGKHTIFASDRNCSSDSVWVYVLEYDSMPVRHSISSPEELKVLSRLDPTSSEDMLNGKETVDVDIPQNIDIRKYIDKIKEVRSLRDSISHYGVVLNDARSRFGSSSNDQEKQNLANKILHHESIIPVLQDSLETASVELQKIEMEFLFSGVVIDPDKVLEAAGKEVVGQSTSYKFTKNSFGGPLELKMMEPEVKFDYTFKILNEGQFALDNTIPDGLVYQIQIFGGGGKASVKSLRGLSPVFEIKTSGGRYVYRVGVFNSYKDVLANLNTVKRAGFRSAFIVAYIDGKEVAVSKARSYESSKSETFYEVRFTPSGNEIDTTVMDGIRQQAGGKDIARSENENGETTYIVGPFTEKDEAMKLTEFIKAMGIGEAICNASGSAE